MTFKNINQHCYIYESAVNVGYVTDGKTGLLIDTGIDKSSVKKVVKELEQHKLPLTHLFITHAHADHYGGAAYLQSHYDIHTLAPHLEEAILRNPSLEPLYLFGGNDPLPELHNKFLQGPEMQVDETAEAGEQLIGTMQVEAIRTPGHSYNQLSLLAYDTLYAADAYFGKDQLDKHRIPYITDVEKTLQSLEKLKGLDAKGAVPGHGRYETDFKDTLQANIDYHMSILHSLEVLIYKHPGGITHEEAVSRMCAKYKVKASKLPQWLLFKTAVTAYLTGLIHTEKITHAVSDFKWTFYPVRS
ncbi:MBL fold metallo-hydrolase [Halobacillus sp. Marseille-Q1614]|uniref:MBL fold metallo-hydrolase n=1 Tax=Halobacillus sp. Marseille-Q1614 TaxID=2709134 RepID=UPI00156FBA3D|nr:MBL fold metallo-hydrolase [Halobacillus sp. Marseille-Q1614]